MEAAGHHCKCKVRKTVESLVSIIALLVKTLYLKACLVIPNITLLVKHFFWPVSSGYHRNSKIIRDHHHQAFLSTVQSLAK